MESSGPNREAVAAAGNAVCSRGTPTPGQGLACERWFAAGKLVSFISEQAQMAPPPLDYIAVPESFKLPPGANFGGTSGVAFNSKGNIFVIHRGPMPVMEFDPDGNFVRGFGDGLFERPHGLRIDARGQHLGDRRRGARGLQVQSVRAARDGARLQEPARRVARVRAPAAVQRAERGGGRPDRRCLRAAGARQGRVAAC